MHPLQQKADDARRELRNAWSEWAHTRDCYMDSREISPIYIAILDEFNKEEEALNAFISRSRSLRGQP